MSEGKMTITPGTWQAINGLNPDDKMRWAVVAVREKYQFLLATIENGAPGDFCETEEANATAIAALPELIALAGVVAAHFADTDAPLGAQARAALAKAGVTK